MTVAIAVKVFDGIVLAADSATTLELTGGGAQVYNTANKIFHLHRFKPIGAMTWGLGNIADASIATLAKDFRRRLMGKDPAHLDWELGDDFTVENVTNRLVEMMHGELYSAAFAGQRAPPTLGFLVAGYSNVEKKGEAWKVIMDDSTTTPQPVVAAGPDDSGWIAEAQYEAVCRLFNGWDPALRGEIMKLIDPAQVPAANALFQGMMRQPAIPPIPFADAINLARFLVEVTAGYSRYLLGPDTVGGPVELAGITRHEGFKWISRKHYYPDELNPEDPHHDY